MTEAELELEVLKYYEHTLKIEKRIEIKINLKIEDMPQSVRDIIPYTDTFEKFKVYKFEEPSTYYILEFEMYRDKQYIYLDENLEPLTNVISSNLRKYRADDFLIISSYCDTYYLNTKGEVIWYEKSE